MVLLFLFKYSNLAYEKQKWLSCVKKCVSVYILHVLLLYICSFRVPCLYIYVVLIVYAFLCGAFRYGVQKPDPLVFFICNVFFFEDVCNFYLVVCCFPSKASCYVHNVHSIREYMSMYLYSISICALNGFKDA